MPPVRGKLCIVYMYLLQMPLHIQVQIHKQMRLHNRVHNEKCTCKIFTSNYTVKFYIYTSSCVYVFVAVARAYVFVLQYVVAFVYAVRTLSNV